MKTVQRFFLTLSGLVGVLVAVWAFGQTNVSADVPVSDLGGNESEVSIAINPQNPDNLVIVGHGPGPEFRLMNTFVTGNGGKGWAQKSLGAAHDRGRGTDPSVPARFDPTVAFDDNGNVYVAYGVTEVKFNRVKVVVCRSISQRINRRLLAGYRYESPCTEVTADPGNDHWQLATGPDPDDPSKQIVYITFVKDANTNSDRIVVFRSTNQGKSFQGPFVASDSHGPDEANRVPSIAVGPEGNVYVTWLKSVRDRTNSNRFLHDKIVVAVAERPSANRPMTFRRDAGGRQEVEVTDLERVAFSFQNRFFLVRPQPDRGIVFKPSIDSDRSGGEFNGRVYIAYIDREAGGPADLDPDTNVFVKRSRDFGKTWEPGQRFQVQVNRDDPGRTQFLPWLSVDQKSGLVGVVWYDARNSVANTKVEVVLGVSTDGGVTFPRNIPVSDRPSDQSIPGDKNPNDFLEYIGLVLFGCEAFTVWADNSTRTNRADLAFFGDRVRDLCD